MGFPGGLDGKEFTCNAGDLGLIPGLGRSPGRGHGNPLQYSCLENPHGQRCLADKVEGRQHQDAVLNAFIYPSKSTLHPSPCSVPQKVDSYELR